MIRNGRLSISSRPFLLQNHMNSKNIETKNKEALSKAGFLAVDYSYYEDDRLNDIDITVLCYFDGLVRQYGKCDASCVSVAVVAALYELKTDTSSLASKALFTGPDARLTTNVPPL